MSTQDEREVVDDYIEELEQLDEEDGEIEQNGKSEESEVSEVSEENEEELDVNEELDKLDSTTTITDDKEEESKLVDQLNNNSQSRIINNIDSNLDYNNIISNIDKHDINEWINIYKILSKRLNIISIDNNNYYKKLIDINYNNDEFINIIKLQSNIDNDRQKEQINIFNNIDKINKMIKSLKYQLNTLKNGIPPTQEFLVNIKAAMDSIENELLEFKTKQRDEYASLHIDMTSLFQELSFYNDRISQWESTTSKPPQKINQYSQIAPSSASTNLYSDSPIIKRMVSNDKNAKPQIYDETSELNESNLPDKLVAELRTLEDTIQMEGGVTGSWEFEDHEMFLKYANLKDEVCLEKCLSGLQLSRETIVHHIEWYKRYQRYVEHKKLLLKEWRQVKEKIRIDALAKELENDKKIDPTRTIAERKAKELENSKKLEQAQKDAEIKASEEHKRELMRMEFKLEKMKFEEEAQRKKSLLQLQRAESIVKTDNILNKVASKTKISKVEQYEQAERLRLKNEELLQKKQELIQAREAKIIERENKLKLLIKNVTPVIEVERDVNRLTDETNLQRSRRLQMEEEKKLQAQNKGRDAGGRFETPRFGESRHTLRAIPLWRQGL